jgi:hypothetical protein
MLMGLFHERHFRDRQLGFRANVFCLFPRIALHAARDWEKAEKYVDNLCEKILREEP